MDTVTLGNVAVSRFILGSNPFSGFSHQSPEVDARMRSYFTSQRIKDLLWQAESLGITAVLGRTDHHIARVLLEYRNEGGKLTWLAQTCPEVGSPEWCVATAKGYGASACHIHGGYMDHLYAAGSLDHIPALIEHIREQGMAAGIAAHNPEVLVWAEENVEADYYMCSYYNSMRREERPDHVAGSKEWFLEEDRSRMTELVQGLSKPAIHYKVMAAGRNDPEEAFDVVAKALRPGDATCVGVFPEDKPDMLAEDVRLLHERLAAHGKLLGASAGA
jgi:hypothetical protein